MPNQFGRYELLERISIGGMAEVFRAQVAGAAGFEKVVAIKRILPQFTDDQRFVSMFVEEARISANLTHSNIGQVYDFGEIDGQYYLAMEYIPGKDLASVQLHFRARTVKMPVPMAIRIGLDLASALHYAHSKQDPAGQPLKIVHRDVSPPNVIITYDGCVKLIDFGIAKAASRSQKTATGLLKGKYGYLSPEQAEGKEIDARSDLFSLGTVLFELVTGERLFHADTELGIIMQVRRAEIPSISNLNPAVPGAFEGIIRRALSRDVAERFQSGAELYEALDNLSKAAGLAFSNMQLAKWMVDTFKTEPGHPLLRGPSLTLKPEPALVSDGDRAVGEPAAPAAIQSRTTPAPATAPASAGETRMSPDSAALAAQMARSGAGPRPKAVTPKPVTPAPLKAPPAPASTGFTEADEQLPTAIAFTGGDSSPKPAPPRPPDDTGKETAIAFVDDGVTKQEDEKETSIALVGAEVTVPPLGPPKQDVAHAATQVDDRSTQPFKSVEVTGPLPCKPGSGPKPLPATKTPRPVPAGTNTPRPAGTNTPRPVPAGTNTPRPVTAGTNTPRPVPAGPAGASNTPRPVPTGPGAKPAGTNTPKPVPTGPAIKPVATGPRLGGAAAPKPAASAPGPAPAPAKPAAAEPKVAPLGSGLLGSGSDAGPRRGGAALRTDTPAPALCPVATRSRGSGAAPPERKPDPEQDTLKPGMLWAKSGNRWEEKEPTAPGEIIEEGHWQPEDESTDPASELPTERRVPAEIFAAALLEKDESRPTARLDRVPLPVPEGAGAYAELEVDGKKVSVPPHSASEMDSTDTWSEATADVETPVRELVGSGSGAGWDDLPTTVHMGEPRDGAEMPPGAPATPDDVTPPPAEAEALLSASRDLDATYQELPSSKAAAAADASMAGAKPMGGMFDDGPTTVDEGSTVALRELSAHDGAAAPPAPPPLAPGQVPIALAKTFEVSGVVDAPAYDPTAETASVLTPIEPSEVVIARDLLPDAAIAPADAIVEDVPSYLSPRRARSSSARWILLALLLAITVGAIVGAALLFLQRGGLQALRWRGSVSPGTGTAAKAAGPDAGLGHKDRGVKPDAARRAAARPDASAGVVVKVKLPEKKTVEKKTGHPPKKVRHRRKGAASKSGIAVTSPIGSLAVSSKPWARVIIDGRDTGRNTPVTAIPLPVGRHKVTLVSGGKRFDFSVELKEGEVTRLIEKLPVPAGEESP